jgi:hypothetical protein
MKRMIASKNKNEILSNLREAYKWKAPNLDIIFKKINTEDADTLQTLFNDAWRKGWKACEEDLDEQGEIAKGNK